MSLSQWTVRDHRVQCFRRDDFDYVALVEDVRRFLSQRRKGKTDRDVVIVSLTFDSHLAHDKCEPQCKEANGVIATLVWEGTS